MGDADWEEWFGFADPHANQRDAIESAIEAGRQQGFLAMERPCGTGKS